MDIPADKLFEGNDSLKRYETMEGLGNFHFHLGHYQRARMCYERAAVLEPDEPDAYVGLGVVALQTDALEDADTAFRVACRLDKECAKGYSGLAMVAHRRGDYERAFQMYLKCLELDVDNFTALLGLFQTSCQMGSFSKVIYYLEVYIKMHPEDTSVMFSLASLYMRDGRILEAKKKLKEILRLDPENEDAINLLEETEHCLSRTAQVGV